MAMLDQPMLDSISYKDGVRKVAAKETSNMYKTNYSGYNAPNYYDQFMQIQNEMLAKQREQTINNIMGQTNSSINNYRQQLDGLGNVYQPIKNQSEVERYKAKGMLRENQANRGALDSGVGRQEQLDISNNHGNRLNQINLQQQNESDNIQRNINEVINQRDLAIANAGADFDVAGLQSSLAAKQQQYKDSAQNNRSNAQSLVDQQKEDGLKGFLDEVYGGYNQKKSSDNKNAADLYTQEVAEQYYKLLGNKT